MIRFLVITEKNSTYVSYGVEFTHILDVYNLSLQYNDADLLIKFDKFEVGELKYNGTIEIIK